MENDKSISELECGTFKENEFGIFGDDYSHEIVKKEAEPVNLKDGSAEDFRRIMRNETDSRK